MVQFRVRATSLGEVAANLNAVIAVFDASVAEVDGKVNGIVNASWQGEDADTFAEAWRGWMATSVTVRASISALSALLVAAEGGYTTTETGVQGSMQRGRQQNAPVVDNVEAVADRVEEGQELAEEQGEAAFATGAAFGTGTGIRPGTGQQQDQGAAVVTDRIEPVVAEGEPTDV